MIENDQLITITTNRAPFINWIGLLFLWGGIGFLFTTLDMFTPIAFRLGVLVIILTGLFILSLRNIHIIDRHKLTFGIYLGFMIPFIGEPRIILKFNQYSIKNFERVIIQHEETFISPEPGIDPGGIVRECFVGLANSQDEIKLATFNSPVSAEKYAEEIKSFLFGKGVNS